MEGINRREIGLAAIIALKTFLIGVSYANSHCFAHCDIFIVLKLNAEVKQL